MDQHDWELLDKQLRGPESLSAKQRRNVFDGRRDFFHWHDSGRHPVRARE